jgi:hypothetical protein
VSGHQADLVTKQIVLIVHIEQGVLLRSADDHSSDNMSNTHGGEKLWTEKRVGLFRSGADDIVGSAFGLNFGNPYPG